MINTAASTPMRTQATLAATGSSRIRIGENDDYR
jgi:hypothetical protein